MTVIRKDNSQQCEFNISIINENSIKIYLNEFFT